MRFEWDDKKSRLNRAKHGISFRLAIEVFADPFCLTIADSSVQGEERFWSIGRLENLVVVLVGHSTRDDEGEEVTRIISAL